MNDSIFDYWSRSEAAENFGISVPTLKKQEEAATEAGYGLSDNFVRKSNTKFWHKDEWNRIQSARLQKYIDEAVKLGLVVTMKTHDELIDAARQSGYDNGYDKGVESVVVHGEIPIDSTHELNELEDVEATGYVVGGFQPLSSLGL
jgi:hypothetical protein